MDAFFPMYVNLSEKRILIVGAGNIASRRLGSLSPFCGDIRVVATVIGDEARALSGDNISFFEREFEQSDLDEIDIAIIATDNHELNEQIAGWCKERGIIKNVSTNQSLCDFFFPSLVIKDDIVVGINSGGRNPGKTKETRKTIQRLLEEN